MSTIKFKSGVVTLTRSELKVIEERAREAAIQELLRREEEVLDVVRDGSLRLVLLTGYKALADMGADYDFAMEFGNIVADTLVQINEGEVTEAQLEQEINDVYGIELVREGE